jgi:nucleoside-diphosphate-sugar epimerase
VRALVIGGTGFLGSCIAHELLKRGFKVRSTTRHRDASEPNSPVENGEIEFVYGNVLERESLADCMKDVDFVFTCFGLLGKWGVPDLDYQRINVEGLGNVLNAIPRTGIRQLIHLSSAGVLGPLPDGVVADESHPFNPSNIYESTKCEAEKKILRYAEEKGIPFTIVRPEFVYGPRDMHVLGLFRAVKNNRFPIIGKGDSLLHPTYVDDFVRGIFLCLNNPIAFGKTYLITGDRAVSVKDLSASMAKAMNTPMPHIRIPIWIALAGARVCESLAKIIGNTEPVLTNARVKFFTENRAFTFAKAQQELGYAPEVSLDEGIRRTVAWYREKGLL